MTDIDKLLIAAMERHITWESVEVNKMAAETSEEHYFSLDVDVSGAPVFCERPTDLETVFDEKLVIHDEADAKASRFDGTDFKKGRYCIAKMGDKWGSMIASGTPRLYRFARAAAEELFPDAAFQQAAHSLGWDVVAVPITTVVIAGLSDYPNVRYKMTLIDLLALVAAQDALKAGRDKDAEALTAILPLVKPIEDADGHLRFPEPRTAPEIYKAVYDHIEQPKPLIVRAGGKQFTEAMGADTRTRNRLFRNSAGTQLTRAGRDGSLVIRGSEPNSPLSVNPGTNKLLVQLGNIIVRDGLSAGPNEVLQVTTSIGEILDGRGLEPTRKNVDRVKKEVFALTSTSWKWTESDGTEKLLTVSGGGAVVNSMGAGGGITVLFSPSFMKLVMNHAAGLVPVDPLLLTTDDNRHKHAWAIGYRLTAHTFMNHGKSNEFRISVESLIGQVKSLPTEDEIERSDRGHQTERIIGPMQRDLDYLVELGVLDYWDYCHSKGEPLTDAEQDARLGQDGEVGVLPYAIAKNCLITWMPTHLYHGAMQALEDSKNRKRLEAADAKAERERTEKSRERRIERRTERLIAEQRAAQEVSGSQQS